MTASEPDRLDRIESTLETVLETIQKLDADLRSTNEQVKKWDGRLWGLTLALISTAWAGIIGATAVVITRSLTGS
ncbi:hypothetical protein [Acaryochloris sp. CCMEE 5410]|uniref:hypothetical protein n=1 Tax=Acaryochloris sp. CCMEE 5410 TaxID=310037 RepID=UPI00024844DD|nr:hypothetical protein [Acaryochloris sp. CCMEE 5410]KAI9129628.1 hypothetical protein ON05_033575 [Acaryochloris sp. CCMEE 5410]